MEVISPQTFGDFTEIVYLCRQKLKTYRIINDITSKHKSTISSKAEMSKITSKADIDIHSTSELDVRSQYMRERDAFLCTAKRNAALMFSNISDYEIRAA